MTETKKAAGLCKTVGKGGVGESGASTLLHHKVTGGSEVIVVVRRGDSSLCGNTGAIALLAVNGTAVVHGTITDDSTSIQTNAGPGDQIVAFVHAIPLFNDVVCVRPGELKFTFEQCDLE